MVQSQVFPRAREGERFQTGGGPPCPAPRLGGLAAGTATRLGTGYAVETMGSGFGAEGERPLLSGARCASVHGFSLHANTQVPAHRRDQLERLIR